MKEKEFSGKFWLPKYPHRCIWGQVTFIPGVGASLLLDDELIEGAGYSSGKVECLFGVLSTGTDCSILNCSCSIEAFRGPTTKYRTKVHAPMLILGGHYSTLGECRFSTFLLRLSHLDQWLAPVFRIERDFNESDDCRISFHPDRLSAEFESKGRKFQLKTLCESKSPLIDSNHAEWSAQYRLQLITDSPVSVEVFLAVASHFRRLFSLLTGRGVFTLSLEAESLDDMGRREGGVNLLIPVAIPNVIQLNPVDFTTHRTLLEEPFSDLVRNWFARSEELDVTVRGYCDLLASDGTQRELIFLRALQLLEHLHGIVLKESRRYVKKKTFQRLLESIRLNFPTELAGVSVEELDKLNAHRDILLSRIGGLNELSFRTRIEQLFLGFPGRVFLPILKDKRDADEFLRSSLLPALEATRHFLTHSDDRNREKSFTREELTDAAICCWCLLTFWIFRAIGVGEERASSLGGAARHVSFLADNESDL